MPNCDYPEIFVPQRKDSDKDVVIKVSETKSRRQIIFASGFVVFLIHRVQPAPRLLLCPQQEGGGFVAVHHKADGDESLRPGLLQKQGAGLPVVVPVEDEFRQAEVVYLHDVFHGYAPHGVSPPP